jgi:ABC-2 type transport system permease protein
MSKSLALMWRELRAYFYSPIAYVVMAAFLVISGIIFREIFVPDQVPDMRGTFDPVVLYILIFVIPLLTMRLVSEELSRGTIETLMTAPVTDTQVILGKFLGALVFYLVLLAPTLVYVVLLAIYSHPDPWPIASGYLGLILVGMVFLSVGLLTSICTRSQIVAAIIALLFLAIMTLMCNWLSMSLAGWARRFFQYIGFYGRYQNFSKGTIPLNDVVFFLSVTVLMLYLSVKILESRKWRT